MYDALPFPANSLICSDGLTWGELTDLDKGSINYASVFGLRQDLNLTGERFSWVVSLFYFGQLVSECPAAYLLSRLPIIPFVGSTIVAWGAVEMCLGATTSFYGIAAARFFLGFTEGCVSPAFVIITSNFYRRREHPMRVASWVSMNGISQMVGALLMYGIGHANMAISSWRGMFLIAGGATVGCGIIFLLMMPRDTSSAWFLNERERQLATHRLAMDRATQDRSEFSRDQMYEALKSPMTWMYALMALGITLPTPILKVRQAIATSSLLCIPAFLSRASQVTLN